MVASSVRSSAVWPVLVGVGLLAGATAAGIGALSLADALTATGLPNPGPVTTYGLPFVRAAGEIAAVVAVGSFLFAAFLVPPQTNGVLDAGGYRALRLGTAASAVWTVCAALLVPLTVSDVSGQPLREHLNPVSIWSAASLVDIAGAWRWTAFLAAAVTLVSLPVLRWSWTPLLLAGALITLVPLGLTGHSSAGGAHDLATNSLLIHLGAAALWAGGLLALLAHAMRAGEHADVAARRFSALALWCFVAMAASGVVNALVRIQLPDLVRTEYGWLMIGKVVALCLLGVLGWRQRRTGVAALRADPDARTPLIRLALVEAAVFGATFGIAVGLGRTPPPPLRDGAESRRGRNRLRLRRAADRGAGAVRLAIRPHLRHRGDRHGGGVPGRGAPVAAPRRRLAGRPHAGVVVGLRGTAVRDVVGPRPLHARDVLACTWWRTCCCRCWCRSCWCSVHR